MTIPLKKYRPSAGLCIVNEANQVLVGRQNNDAGHWKMPQGGVDKGEHPQEAALRELFEETTLVLKPKHILATTGIYTYEWETPGLKDGIFYHGQAQMWYFARFPYKDGTPLPDPKKAQDQEFTALKWKSIDGILSNCSHFRQAMYKHVFADFGLL